MVWVFLSFSSSFLKQTNKNSSNSNSNVKNKNKVKAT